MTKEQAKQILINTGYIGNEVGVAFDVAIKSIDKLEKIEQIVKQVESLHPEVAIGDREGIRKIKEVLKQE